MADLMTSGKTNGGETEAALNTGLDKRGVPRLRELAPRGQRESGGRIHAT